MKIGELDQHCGNCTVEWFCGNTFGYLLCTDKRFSDMEQDAYRKLAEQAEDIPSFDTCYDCERFDHYNNEPACDFTDEPCDFFCEQVADFVAARIGRIQEN